MPQHHTTVNKKPITLFRLLPTAVVVWLICLIGNSIFAGRVDAYVPNLHNLTGCLYSYIGTEGQYDITFLEDNPQSGPLNIEALHYDSKTACTGPEGQPGYLVLNYNTADNNMVSMSIELQIKQSPKAHFWEINRASVTVKPTNKALFPKETIELKAARDMYAGAGYSYSCSSLVLRNAIPSLQDPQIRITLKRFQLQPFGEPPLTVFAKSYDCSVYLTLPQIMGFLLVFFIIFTVLIGVYWLLDLGGQGGDLRFSKQGGMLMNQAQLDATKAD